MDIIETILKPFIEKILDDPETMEALKGVIKNANAILECVKNNMKEGC